MAYLRDLWNFDQSLKPSLFYDKHRELNSFFDESLASSEALKNLQIRNLKSLYGQKQSYKILNQFLKDALGDTQGTDEDLFAQLVNGINAGWDGFRHPKNRINKTFDPKLYEKSIEGILAQINSCISSIPGAQPIPAPSLDGIITAVKKRKYRDFINEKGKYLEEIGTWIMQCAGLIGVNTGAWVAEDAFFNEQSEKQLIEDAMGFISESLFNQKNISNNFLKVQITGYSKSRIDEKRVKNQKLQEWVNSIKELNGLTVSNGEVMIGSNISSVEQFEQLISLIDNNATADFSLNISLSPNLHKELRKLSVNIQGKSNIERHLANKGRAKYRMNKDDKYYRQLQSFSTTEPVIKETAVSKEEFKHPYETFAAYVNYNLSRNINKTIYARNEFYLTKEGFADLPTLMQKRGFYIRIEDTSISYEKFLSNVFNTIYS